MMSLVSVSNATLNTWLMRRSPFIESQRRVPWSGRPSGFCNRTRPPSSISSIVKSLVKIMPRESACGTVPAALLPTICVQGLPAGPAGLKANTRPPKTLRPDELLVVTPWRSPPR